MSHQPFSFGLAPLLRLGGLVALVGGLVFAAAPQLPQAAQSAPHNDTPTPTLTATGGLTATITATVSMTATATATATPATSSYCPVPPVDFSILPMGDSLTAGLNSDAGGYRGYLYDKLVKKGFPFKFVGGQHGRGPLGPPSDNDNHEGYAGYYTYQFFDMLEFGMNGFTPNVILMLVGTNDSLSSDTPHADNVQNYNTLMEKVLTKWKGVHLVVAKIPRNKIEGKTEVMAPLNQEIENLAALRVAQGHKVYVVDMFAVIGPEDIHDLLHPNEQGYQKMSEVWLNGVCRVAASLVPITPTP
ncbi:MAG: GDSL-type esterase/lipase family protein, partial [Anaerolineae bacterium]|nr:GDSL-type esterase/lipase family protein [Anaerolineae bacterium]